MLVTFYKNLAEKNLKKVLFLVLINIFVSNVYGCILEKKADYLMNIFRILRYLSKNKKQIAEKRERVQKIRKCSDKEIFSTFSALIIVPKGMRKFSSLPRLFLKLINLYISITKIPVQKFKGFYYY